MRLRRKRGLTGLAIVLVIGALAGARLGLPAFPASGEGVPVIRVVDGDTIRVQLDGREVAVRYIGIDTPELGSRTERFGREATERNRQLVEGKRVRLEKDVSEADRFGRLLRYVWVGDRMVNAVLVEEGYANAVSYPPDVKYHEMLRERERAAREAKRGLWAN